MPNAQCMECFQLFPYDPSAVKYTVDGAFNYPLVILENPPFSSILFPIQNSIYRCYLIFIDIYRYFCCPIQTYDFPLVSCCPMKTPPEAAQLGVCDVPKPFPRSVLAVLPDPGQRRALKGTSRNYK